MINNNEIFQDDDDKKTADESKPETPATESPVEGEQVTTPTEETPASPKEVTSPDTKEAKKKDKVIIFFCYNFYSIFIFILIKKIFLVSRQRRSGHSDR